VPGHQAFDRPGIDFGGPKVLRGSTPGQVLLLTNHGCASVATPEAEPGAEGKYTSTRRNPFGSTPSQTAPARLARQLASAPTATGPA
jgi:hypothetical protein